MKPGRQREEEVFEAARQIADAAERRAFLEGACGGDNTLRTRVEGMLAALPEADQFFAEGAGTMTVAPSRARAQTEGPGDHIGPYKLLEQIGEGGCGVVYVAEQVQPVRRRVALKIIKLGMETRQVIARFEAERQALALMDHPHIAKVFDAGVTDNGRPYFVMELVKGIPITRFCDESHVETRQRIELFIKVCQAIQHAHQKGIIHRDIKPSNVLVCDHDGVPVPKVIDFGIAKATGGQVLTDKTVYTAFEQFIGTPAYMSPEQTKLSGLDIDTRSDIYSLGVLLYELLTGQTPFDARKLLEAGFDEIRRVIREVDPPRPSTRLSTLAADEQTSVAKQRRSEAPRLIRLVRGDLDWIVMKCLEKDRARRYETANGLARDLQRHLHNEPVLARPPGRVYQFQKLVRRNRAAFAAGGAVAAALILGLVLALAGFAAKSKALRRAISAEQAASAQAARADENARSESRQRHHAEAIAAELKSTLSTSDFLQAMRLLREEEASEALAYLGRALSINPTNQDALMRLVNLLTYRAWPLPSLVVTQENEVMAAEFSPDGRRIVAGLRHGPVRVWEAATGRRLAESRQHLGYAVFSVQFSPDGNSIATASWDQTARVMDVRDGAEMQRLQHSDVVRWASFSPDGKRLVTACWDKAVHLWDAHNGRELLPPLANDEPMLCARFSPDGKVIAGSCSWVRFWDAESRQPTWQPLKQSSGVKSVQFNPEGTRILLATGTEAQVRDSRTGQPVSAAMKHPDVVYDASFSPDGRRVATASVDGKVRLWDAETGTSLPIEPIKHAGQVLMARFSPDGGRIVTASRDRTAVIWQAAPGRALAESWKLGADVNPLDLAHGGARLAAVVAETNVMVWDLTRQLPETDPLHFDQRALSTRLSPDGKWLAVLLADNSVVVFDAGTRRRIGGPLSHDGPVHSVVFSPDGSRVVTSSARYGLRLWQAAGAAWASHDLLRLRPENADFVSVFTFSPDSQRIVMESQHVALILDAETGREFARLSGHGGPLESAQFSADGRWIATGSDDRTALIWDAETGRPLIRPIRHSAAVRSVCFSPDGDWLLTAASRAVRLWDVHTGEPVTEPLIHPRLLEWAQFAGAGRRVVAAASDRSINTWFVAPATLAPPAWFLDLAEAVAGQFLTQNSMLEPARMKRDQFLSSLRDKLNDSSDTDDWTQWGRWFLADPRSRALFPGCRLTVSEHIENRLKEGGPGALAEAELLAYGNPTLLARVRQARAALPQSTAPAAPQQ